MHNGVKLGSVASVLVACGAIMSFAASALNAQAQEQPSLQKLLGRAQSQSERKAVEDLIGKLKGADSPTKQEIAPNAPERAEETKPVPSSDSDKSAAAPASDADTSQSEERAATTGQQTLPAETPSSNPVETAKTEEGSQGITLSPDAVVERAERNQLPSVDLEVQFEFNSAQMTPAAIEALTPLGHALSDARLADGQFLIAGHTDGKGKASYNLGLSQRRAEAVRQFLVKNFNLDDTRLVAKGFGERHLKNAQQPLAAENRRVQIVNMSSAAAAR